MKALGFDLLKSDILSILQMHEVPSEPPSTNAPHQSRLLLPFAQFQIIMAERIIDRDPADEEYLTVIRDFALRRKVRSKQDS
jgi:centrin-3